MQIIDYKKLLQIAEKHDFLIQILYRAGKFIFDDLPIFIIYHDEKIDKQIKKACLSTLTIGRRRSTVQDIEFAFEELAEITVRALSPGVNNTYTAIHSIDKMIKGFEVLNKKSTLPKIMCDQQGKERVIREVASYKDIVRTTFNRVRQAAIRDLAVSLHILHMLARLFQLNILFTNEFYALLQSLCHSVMYYLYTPSCHSLCVSPKNHSF